MRLAGMVVVVLLAATGTAQAFTDPVADPVQGPAHPFLEPTTLYRTQLERFRLEVDFTLRPDVSCDSTCALKGRIVVRLKPGRGSGHLFHFRRRPAKGGGSFSFDRGTTTSVDFTRANGTTCSETVDSTHGFETLGAVLRPRRRVHVGMDARLLGYFSTGGVCFGGPADDELGRVAGAFPDRFFPRGRFAKKRFTMNFGRVRDARLEMFDVRVRQDVRIKVRRTRRTKT